MNILSKKNKIPWYVAGLAFECQQCGGCCSGPVEGFVWATDDEIAAVAAHLKMTDRAFRDIYIRRVGRRFSFIESKPSNNCIFLHNGACKIYSVRPVQCGTWPYWIRNIETPEDWSQAASRCPGINRGETIDVEEIEKRANATRE